MIGALLAVTVVAAPLAQAAAAPRPTAIAVRVEAAAAAADVKPALDELRAAIGARKEEFRPLKAGEKPGLVVRVDAVKAADGMTAMNGALIKGDLVRPFGLRFPGDLKATAAAFARNLRGYADQMTPAKKSVP